MRRGPYAQLVARLTSGRLACSDVEANLTTGVVSAVEAAWLRDAAGCLPPAATVDVLLEQLNRAAPHWGVRLTGIAVEDLRGGARWAVNGDQQMSFMSSAKIAWAVMAAAQAGTDAVEPFAYQVFARSDNDAAGSLIDLAGGIDRLNRYWYPTLSMVGSCHQRWNAAQSAVRRAVRVPHEPGVRRGEGAHVLEPQHGQRHDQPPRAPVARSGPRPSTRRSRPGCWSGRRGRWRRGRPTGTGQSPVTSLPGRGRTFITRSAGFSIRTCQRPTSALSTYPTPYALALAAYGGESSAAQADFLSWASCQVYRHLAGDSTWTCPPRADDARPGQLDVALAPTATGSTLPTPIPGGRTSSHLITTPTSTCGSRSGRAASTANGSPCGPPSPTANAPSPSPSPTRRSATPAVSSYPKATARRPCTGGRRWPPRGRSPWAAAAPAPCSPPPTRTAGCASPSGAPRSAQLDVAGQLDGR